MTPSSSSSSLPFSSQSCRTKPVYLVGAGPGDPGLITVRGKQLIELADILIYDYLANQAFLDYCPADAQRIFVGKKGFSKHVTQEEINTVLVSLAQKYPEATIVRLKGGDPFVFGRGGEEALALAQAHLPFEVVPGITSGIAASAYAGIPVTHRGLASSMAFITGHETPEKNESAINWEQLARGVDTLCFYMGIRNLPLITKRLMDAGRSPDTPVALIRWGSLPQQKTLISTLQCVADDAARAQFSAPAITVVGDVVNLHEQLAWFEIKPLFGKRIVVTRTRAQAPKLSGQLRQLGADVWEVPTIRIEALPLSPSIAKTIEDLPTYDWVVFTSPNGVKAFFDFLAQTDQDARAFAHARVAAIGPATAASLAACGIHADVVPSEYKAENTAEELIDAGVAQQKVLIARAEQAREVLPELLTQAGATVDVLPVYRTVPDGEDTCNALLASLEKNEIDAITFTASSTVKNFWTLLEVRGGCSSERTRQLLHNVSLFSIGPITSDTLRSFALEPTAEASPYTIDSLVETMLQIYCPEQSSLSSQQQKEH